MTVWKLNIHCIYVKAIKILMINKMKKYTDMYSIISPLAGISLDANNWLMWKLSTQPFNTRDKRIAPPPNLSTVNQCNWSTQLNEYNFLSYFYTSIKNNSRTNCRHIFLDKILTILVLTRFKTPSCSNFLIWNYIKTIKDVWWEVHVILKNAYCIQK